MKPHGLGRLTPRRRRNEPAAKSETVYAFCEPVTAGSLSPWHIRPLGPKGLCPGGGADTLALCGRGVSWDIAKIPVDEEHLALYESGDPLGACKTCTARWRIRGSEGG